MDYQLKTKIQNKTAHIGIIGLGYVGLPLAIAFAKKGYTVIGFDVDGHRVSKINDGISFIEDISSQELSTAIKSGGFRATTDFTDLQSIDCVSICVPTPLNKTHDPDVSYILESRSRVAENIHPHMLVVLESTTYPGTTDELFVPMIEGAGYTLGQDFFLSFSPERIDPANPKFNVTNTPKIVGGYTSACTELTALLYSQIVNQVVPVSSTRVAEMAKILENTYRAVNIGLVNEVAIMCQILKIDVWEVISAASTKPFGFTPFYPGPGLGGHCIPVDPHYLSWKMKSLNYQARFIDLAGQVNTHMPLYVVGLVTDALNERQKSVKGSKIMVLGMAYKPNISDTRESPSFDVFKLLESKGAQVCFNDPHASTIEIDGRTLSSTPITPQTLADQDAVVVTTAHGAYHAQEIVAHAKLVIDTRNMTEGLKAPHIVKL